MTKTAALLILLPVPFMHCTVKQLIIIILIISIFPMGRDSGREESDTREKKSLTPLLVSVTVYSIVFPTVLLANSCHEGGEQYYPPLRDCDVLPCSTAMEACPAILAVFVLACMHVMLCFM